jgi:hypothetical protein
LNLKVIERESRHRQYDAQAILVELFDVIRRIAVCGLCDAVDSLLELLETEQ